MNIDIRLPNITGTSEAEQLLQVKSYLYQLVEQLNWALKTIEGDASGQQVMVKTTGSTAQSSEKEAQTTFNSIKSLIIKSADIVNAYYEKINTRLTGEYVAISDFGTFKQNTSNSITANSEAIKQFYENVQEIIADIDTLETKLIDVSAYINSGLLYYNDSADEDNYIEEIADGAPIYGLEIGEKVSNGETETFNQFARFVANRLTFYDSNGNAVSWISDKRLHIKNAEITVSFTVGKLVDTVLPDGSVVTR